MQKDLWQRAEELFHTALEQSPEARRAFLDKACGEDSELRRQVETLLSQDEQAGSFLEKPALADVTTTPGTRGSLVGRQFGPYRILSSLGAGGMGEVYRAHDGKLGRDVAIKTLTLQFARDPERIARFQREAKLLASLNHPNIASIYGLEESDGTSFLILELVEGDTLADRIKAGSIPVEESLKLALQIAEALESAHEKGVIHRDLKPANIKVTPEGKVKVLDFGLAKAFAGEQAELNLSNSPTLSDMATQQGVILGTAAYMSPEQARGKSVDKRADIWAFGCVLYEMLTGQAAFQGEDVTEVLASVVKGEANLDLLPPNLHPRVCEAIKRCLQKDLRRRYQGIADASYEIGQALAIPGGVLTQPVTTAQPRKRLRTMLPWIAAALVFGLIIAGVAVWNLKPSEPRHVTRFEYSLPEGEQLNAITGPALAISPDGRRFVYVTAKGLYSHSLDEFAAKPIVGTETSAAYPFFSPDGKWVGYYSDKDQKLKKIPISGGDPVTLCDASSFAGADWGVDDEIVYAQYPIGAKYVPANGGTPELIVKGAIRQPRLLPDGKSLLFTSGAPPYKIMVQSLQSGEPRELFDGDNARYISTGHIVYVLGNNLLAVPFDLKTLKVTGRSVPVVEGIWRFNPLYPSQYAVTDSGTLSYITGQTTRIATGRISQRWRLVAANPRMLVWVDRKGKEIPIAVPPNNYSEPRISPDGTKVALTISAGEKSDIWIWDIARESMTRLTFNERSSSPLWTPDGKRILFLSDVDNKPVICGKAADGTGEDEKLGSAAEVVATIPWSWSGDGKTLVTIDKLKDGNDGVGAITMEGGFKWRSLLASEKYWLTVPMISPDGRWMAYWSSESGQGDVYVRQFPEINKGRWQISLAGGIGPLWSPDGRELFYRNGDAFMVVEVQTEPAFKPGKPEILFRGSYSSLAFQEGHPWDISHDGKRFLMMKPFGASAPTGEAPRKINIILNWFEELKQRVPVHVQ